MRHSTSLDPWDSFSPESDGESSDFSLTPELTATSSSLFEITEYSSWTCVSSVYHLNYPVSGAKNALV